MYVIAKKPKSALVRVAMSAYESKLKALKKFLNTILITTDTRRC